jgi:hypothetical protein
MSLFTSSCPTCRALRRVLLAFALGGVVAWQVTGNVQFQTVNDNVLSGLMAVVVIFAFLNVFMRMREMRARFRKRG